MLIKLVSSPTTSGSSMLESAAKFKVVTATGAFEAGITTTKPRSKA